jgi:hypothetical protein
MRHDMAKVIVERPRWGGGAKYPRAVQRSDNRHPLEELPRRTSAKRPWLVDGRVQKCLNENLAPLRRYLRSQVGRPWNKVYSEIRERINPDSAVQLHIWQHLMEYVCTDPHVITGDVGDVAYHGFRRPLRYFAYYVDPRCGLLRENAEYGRRWRSAAPRRAEAWPGVVEVDDDHAMVPLEGLWFELRLVPEPAGRGRVYDHVLRREIDIGGTDLRVYRGRRVYVAAKRQLNKRDIRHFDLPAVSATGGASSGTMTAV